MSDIFVALPNASVDGSVLFAKNSDRPSSEVQEVVYVPPTKHDDGTKLHCTFIEVDQAEETYGVVLSKPAWAWGAEMGSNEHGVCVGNTSVWTKLCHPGDHAEKLIGVDFVRLALERSKTAEEGVGVITGLLEQYGQGGPTCEDHSFSQWTYNNTFVLADRSEVWLLDTAGPYWAGRKITEGTHNTSSCLSIGCEYDVCSRDLQEHAKSDGYWKPEEGDFNFAAVFGDTFTGISLSDSQRAVSRLSKGKQLLDSRAAAGKLTQDDMFAILRDTDSSINFSGELQTMGSQVSVLRPSGSSSVDIHYFTATPDPSLSVFKPFFFSSEPGFGKLTTSPIRGDKARASFQTAVERRHPLFIAHEKARAQMEAGGEEGQKLLNTMRSMETDCVQEIRDFVASVDQNKLQELNDLFYDLCSTEIKFYR